MVTKRKPTGRHKIVKAKVVILFVVLIGLGFFFGRITAPVKVETVTITETVEVSVPSTEELPILAEISYYDVPLSLGLQDYIYELCAEEHIPMSLIIAMIDHESKFNPETVSATSDYGLMQINVINHERLEEQYHCADMLNPCTNGTRNACSMLYGACCRVAKGMGYKLIITYILKSENGASLKASNFVCDGVAGGTHWTGERNRGQDIPSEMKTRWHRRL